MASLVGAKRKYAAINKQRGGRAHDSDGEDISDDEYDPVSGMGSSGAAGGAGAARQTNVAGLKNALAELVREQPWLERLEVVSAEPINVDAADDLKLELAFYGQALAAVTAARGELERLGVPHRRPEDFLAEMMKSDDHMAKIKDRLITEQKRLSAVDARRKQRDSLKYLKQVAAEKAKSKAAERRAHDETLKQWRKHRGDAEHATAAHDFEAALAGKGKAGGAGAGGAGAGGGAAAGGPGGPRGDRDRAHKNGRRKAKDNRYGFGGPKRFKKDNSASSSRDTKSFSVARNKALPPGIKFKGRPGGGGSAGGKGAGRPGKRARTAGKSKGKGGR